MSLFERLDLTKYNRKLKLPLSERIDLTRTPRPRCRACRLRIQPHWEFCPSCGLTLIKLDTEFRHCVWIDMLGMEVQPENKEAINTLFIDAFSKLYGAFRGIDIFLTSDSPDPKEWGEDFTHVYIFADNQPVDYLGIASLRPYMITNRAIIRIDQVFCASYRKNLSTNNLSNLIANTIAHEIGHTLGLDHSILPTDVMHDGLDYTIHSLMPPSFHAEQINLMNAAIRRHKASKSSSP